MCMNINLENLGLNEAMSNKIINGMNKAESDCE